MYYGVFFFQAEDGIRDLVRSRGLGDVYKRQEHHRRHQRRHRQRGHPCGEGEEEHCDIHDASSRPHQRHAGVADDHGGCLLYTSDAADERSSVDLGGRRIIKKKKQQPTHARSTTLQDTSSHKSYILHAQRSLCT